MDIAELVALILLGGAGLVGLAYWSRRLNSKLGHDSSAWAAQRQGLSLKHLFFGTRSQAENYIGTALAWGAIALIAAFLAFAAWAILRS